MFPNASQKVSRSKGVGPGIQEVTKHCCVWVRLDAPIVVTFRHSRVRGQTSRRLGVSGSPSSLPTLLGASLRRPVSNLPTVTRMGCVGVAILVTVVAFGASSLGPMSQASTVTNSQGWGPSGRHHPRNGCHFFSFIVSSLPCMIACRKSAVTRMGAWSRHLRTCCGFWTLASL